MAVMWKALHMEGMSKNTQVGVRGEVLVLVRVKEPSSDVTAGRV